MFYMPANLINSHRGREHSAETATKDGGTWAAMIWEGALPRAVGAENVQQPAGKMDGNRRARLAAKQLSAGHSVTLPPLVDR